MSEDESVPGPALWTRAGFVADEWTRAETPNGTQGNANIFLPLAGFLEAAGAGGNLARLGVELAPGDAVEAIVPFLDRVGLVALAFPAYTDGRSYSKAVLLRERHGYKGRLRARGDVLIDQVQHMLRTGFDELEVSSEPTRARLEAGRTGQWKLHYQPAAAPEEPAGYVWRRRPAA